MQLFETKMMLRSIDYGISIEVPSTEYLAMLRAVKNSNVLDGSATINMFLDHDYSVTDMDSLSDEVRHTLDIIGIDWVRSHKLSAIRLIRHLTKASLLDAKNAVEGYLA